MTRGYRPVVAIAEAERQATAWGFIMIGLITETKLHFDFIIHDRGCTSLVRIRRLKYAGYGLDTIKRTCSQQIMELQALTIPEGIYRELWVRGPERSWHRYRILQKTIEAVANPPRINLVTST